MEKVNRAKFNRQDAIMFAWSGYTMLCNTCSFPKRNPFFPANKGVPAKSCMNVISDPRCSNLYN